MTINQSIDQSSNQSSDPIDPCNQTGMMYNNQANNGVQMENERWNEFLLLEGEFEMSPIYYQNECLDPTIPQIPFDQLDPADRAIMEARVARSPNLIPIGTFKDQDEITNYWYANPNDLPII